MVTSTLYSQTSPATRQALTPIEEKTKDCKKLSGYLNLYWEEHTGKLYLEVKTDSQLLYQQSLPAGLGSNDIGLDRGLLGDTRIVVFKRIGRKILMVQPNLAYRAITNDENEKKAVEESFATSTLWGFTLEAESNGNCLVDITDFIVRDAMGAANRIRKMQQGNFSFDKTRSAIYLQRTKNFPQNTEIEASITLTNSDAVVGNMVQSVAPSSDAITLRMHHSFVQLPGPGFTPRLFDPRSSFINTSYFDYSSPVSEPIEKHFIIRHRLQKKQPAAAISEPVKPITYYLDNGTPEPIRSALLEGASWWNQAFEAAGYKNAFVVKLLPDSADPMDVRYNVINWVHRSTRGWSYGNAVVDPRTGEIIKGHVSLGSLRVRQDYLIATGLLAPFDGDALPADDKMLQMALARLKQLSAHEVGHTLGLMHNYAASSSNRASVMDYPHPQATINPAGKIVLSDAYAAGIGEWDKVAINWGYRDDANSTPAAANKILTDAQAKGLQYISDRDARAAGSLHPQAHLWDNGADAVAELHAVIKVRNKALQQFSAQNIPPGTPMAMLEDALVPVYFYHRYQLEAVAKIVGGLYYTYALRGDGQVVTKAIDKQQQLSALNALMECLQPAFLAMPAHIAPLIPPRPAGYDFTRELFKKRTGLAFDVLSPAETAADFAFAFLLHTERLNRMVQYQAANNGLGLDEMLLTLIEKTWKAPRQTGMLKLIQQQTAQVLLTYLIAASADDNASFETKAIVGKSLADLSNYIAVQQKQNKDASWQAHLQLAAQRIKMPEKAKPSMHTAIPPGAPIGCEE
ncbi:MAG: hypothetical protein RL172_925 [Bacteroidota bacterium]